MSGESRDIQLAKDLQRLRFELHSRFGVIGIGYFYPRESSEPVTKEVNIVVELAKPLGWKFFEMKEYLEKRLSRRIDVVTLRGIKSLYMPEVAKNILWL